ncbi:hypothetical protein LTR36_007141 [Oleoguttula mirabilis]|uniref:NAD(P)-binding protein n=1 Tax=Oleoguttula mirabilis TaxID=1507867 RepID=A0AAV9JAF7_9PEZI|nr:hypothetical protein LTR36_007141 [Oleoguttula mirabilis]
MVVGDIQLKGKIAVVTGGGSGINFAFVRLALAAEARVLVADIKLLPEAEKLVDSSNGNATFMKCDVSDWSDLEAIPSEVFKAFGPGAVADVWIAGAGVFEPKWSSFLYDTENDHYKALQINTEHPIKLTRIAMRSCLGANKPCVVLIVGSTASITGSYGAALYCASKHAVAGFTKSMTQADVDENCKIVCICPGMVSTPLWTGDAAKDVAEQYSYTDEVCITPEDVAEAMMEMVQSGEYPGGSLLECSKRNLRERLESREAGALVMASKSAEPHQWVEKCYAPIREVWKKERGVATSGVH